MNPLPPPPPPAQCSHNYQYQGVVWSLGDRLPGSGASERVYHDRYYCSKCLDIADRNPRVQGNSYGHPIPGSTPK